MKEKTKLPDEQPLGKFLASIGRKFLREINSGLHSMDIERDFYALMLIENNNGKITQQELAGKLGTDKVCVVRVLDYLSDHGYVTRKINFSDRRAHKLFLTRKAIDRLPAIRKAVEIATEKALTGLSEEEIDCLYHSLRIIHSNLSGAAKITEHATQV